jgi:hypothetical protein
MFEERGQAIEGLVALATLEGLALRFSGFRLFGMIPVCVPDQQQQFKFNKIK